MGAAPGNTWGHEPADLPDFRSRTEDFGSLAAYRSQFGTVYPLTERQLVELFGTAQPTREHVESRPYVYEGLRDRWVGLYIIVYRDGEPDEILFTGYSGD
jgi:hypothetical protein